MSYFLLDFFRGFAALWVFAFHYGFSTDFRETFPLFSSFLDEGALGVPMFFVISGYCITASARNSIKKNKSTQSFLWRRFRRIYPTYWFSILVLVALPFLIEVLSFAKTGQYISPDSDQWRFISFDSWQWLRLVSLTEVFWPHPDATHLSDKFSPINSPYWSLAIEVQFYLVVAGCIALPRKYFLSYMAVVTFLSFLALMFGLPATLGLFLNSWPGFALGSAVAILIEKNHVFGKEASPLRRYGFGFIGGFALILLAIYLTLFNGCNEILFATVFAFSLWAMRPLDVMLGDVDPKSAFGFMLKAISFLGVMSYSIYLLHGKLMILAAQLSRQVMQPDSIIFDATVICMTCLMCLPFYYCFEKPFASMKLSAKQLANN